MYIRNLASTSAGQCVRMVCVFVSTMYLYVSVCVCIYRIVAPSWLPRDWICWCPRRVLSINKPLIMNKQPHYVRRPYHCATGAAGCFPFALADLYVINHPNQILMPVSVDAARVVRVTVNVCSGPVSWMSIVKAVHIFAPRCARDNSFDTVRVRQSAHALSSHGVRSIFAIQNLAVCAICKEHFAGSCRARI